jgi:hypothetical protein
VKIDVNDECGTGEDEEEDAEAEAEEKKAVRSESPEESCC